MEGTTVAIFQRPAERGRERISRGNSHQMTILEAHYDATLAAEIRALAKERNAVILAHNYERPEIQDVADFVGDSLGLSREAAKTEADVIVFCGVHFMAETAAILSPQKTVLLPDLAAGCSLASTIDAEQLRAWKAQHPGAVVVAYVNTTAEVKAESDYCCTSSNAVEVVNAIPADKEILFLPDMFLGAHVRRESRRENIHVWLGECHVHAGIDPEHISNMRAQQASEPDRSGHVHCGHRNRHSAPAASSQSHQALHCRERSGAVRVYEGDDVAQGA